MLAGAGGRHPVTAESEGNRHLCPRHQLRPRPRLSLRLPDDAALQRAQGDGGEDITPELHLRPLHRQHLQRHLVIRSEKTFWFWKYLRA